MNKKKKREKERKRERERFNEKLVKIDPIRCAAGEPPMIDTHHRPLVRAHAASLAHTCRKESTH